MAHRRSSSGDVSWPLERAARVHGRAPGVIDAARELRYDELAGRVGALGTALDELGVPPGGRVGVLAANSLAHLECFLGVPSSGRVLVDLNFRLAEEELAFMTQDAGVEVLVTDGDQLAVARRLRNRCPALRTLVHDSPAPCPQDCVAYDALLVGRPRRRPEPERTSSR